MRKSAAEVLVDDDLPVEVDVKFAARHLGTTPRTVINYLKSRQLEGEKVGKEWHIRTESLFRLRPRMASLKEVVLPAVENPKSKSQFEKEKRKAGSGANWSLTKAKRHPMKLRSFAHLKEAVDLLNRDRTELSDQDAEFLQNALEEIGDDLGAGYYSFGPMKRKLYLRARIRAGRVVSRSILYESPQGMIMAFCQLADSISFLCRNLDRRKVKDVQV
jgi:hypothetical protein